VAAGSAVGSSLISCSDVTIILPCLGPAAAPVPVPGMTYIRASEIGCALDCDLATGRNKHTGHAATDDGPKINAAMAAATADHPITLIIDGSALISGLFLPAGGYWSIAGLGCGTGFYVMTGTNNDGIHNGPPDAASPSDPGPPVPARGRNVSLSNFTVNGNKGNGHHGNSTTGQPQGSNTTWYFGINLMNLDNIVIENVVVVNAPAYQIRLSNVGNVTVTGCVLQGTGANSDGLHFDGPANDIAISNCDFKVDDDSIALNCPEGHGGNISRVTVKDCKFDSFSLMRLYTVLVGPDRFTVDTVNVSGCSGTLSEYAFVIGWRGGSLPDSVTSLTVSDCTLTAPTILGVVENFGTVTLRNIVFTPSLSGVWWGGPQVDTRCALLRPAPSWGAANYTGSNLVVENCVISRNSDTKVTAAVVENGTSIVNLTFNGFSVSDMKSYSPLPVLLVVGEGSISQLVLQSLNSSQISAPISMGEFVCIGSVSGAGVFATAWEFPDAVMANEVPYISANSGLPSIKVGGIVEPYQQP
jgi:hypothetical protein